jgi:RNA polymerase sigma factor (sigma-70 family)
MQAQYDRQSLVFFGIWEKPMATSPPGSISKLLADIQHGIPRAEEHLWERIYDELYPLHFRQCHIVEALYFGGFTMREIAEQLGVSEATVSVDFKRAKLWLATRLEGGRHP